MKHFLAVALLACAFITSCKKPIEPYGPLPIDSVRGAAFSKMINEVFAVDLARNIK